MKYTLAELKKKQYQNDTISKTLDYSDYLKDPDLINIAPVEVQGEFEVEDNRYYHFYLKIKTTLTMACAITLDPVEVPLDIDVTETFSEDENDDYRQIEGITIDLYPIIWSNIYLEKPLRVVKENATFKSDQKPQEKSKVNPAFKNLKKYK